MIQIVEKYNCCGCHACYNICPQQAISMSPDEEGFLYPKVDVNKCTDCHKCEKVCPLLGRGEISNIPANISGIRTTHNDILSTSSSGGLFSILAQSILDNKGYVTAASFDNDNNVVHATSNLSIAQFRGSKYLQSVIGDTFKQIKTLLLNGNEVMFVGTPCQITGLKSYLQKDFSNLYCIDFVCHGVPSPIVWKEYIKTLGKDITSINFRDKTSGWPEYSFSYIKENIKYIEKATNNPYMKGFLHDLYLRPSCYRCKFKNFSSGSDLTMSDFWGVWKNHSSWNDKKGAGIVATHTNKGEFLINRIDPSLYEKISISYKQAYVDYNCSARIPTTYNPQRDIFFKRFGKEPLVPLIMELSKDSIKVRIKNFISSIIRK